MARESHEERLTKMSTWISQIKFIAFECASLGLFLYMLYEFIKWKLTL